MKLKTKFQDEDFKLGEVTDVDIATMPDGRIKAQAIAEAGGNHTFYYDNLQEMYEKWEDAPEEPKTFWAISWAGEPEEYDAKKTPQELKDMAKQIGNYFETKEEAEKAVEKLKAWKRLKDKGFRFCGLMEDYTRITGGYFPARNGRRYLQFNKSEEDEWLKENWEDLDLLFGGDKK